MAHLTPARTMPAFATEAGLTYPDIKALDGEMAADPHSLHSVNRDAAGAATGVERMRGLRHFTFTGQQSLFAAPWSQRRPRLLVAAGPFEAACAAAYEGHRRDTIYAAVPGQLVRQAQEAMLALIHRASVTHVVLAFPASTAGHRLTCDVGNAIHAVFIDMVELEELVPPEGRWSGALRALRLPGRAA